MIKLLLPEHFRLRASSVAITWIIRPMRSLSISTKRLGCDRTYIAKYIIISCKDKSIRAPIQRRSSWPSQSQSKHWCCTGHSRKNPSYTCCLPVSGLQYWCLGHWLHKSDPSAPQVAVGCKKAKHSEQWLRQLLLISWTSTGTESPRNIFAPQRCLQFWLGGCNSFWRQGISFKMRQQQQNGTGRKKKGRLLL